MWQEISTKYQLFKLGNTDQIIFMFFKQLFVNKLANLTDLEIMSVHQTPYPLEHDKPTRHPL